MDEGVTPQGRFDPDLDPHAADELERLRSELSDADPAVVIANHCFGLFELAAVYLSATPAKLHDAQLAIDALAALIEGLEGRLGDGEAELAAALAQLRLADVQIHAASTSSNGGTPAS